MQVQPVYIYIYLADLTVGQVSVWPTKVLTNEMSWEMHDSTES